jgi:MFS family permease
LDKQITQDKKTASQTQRLLEQKKGFLRLLSAVAIDIAPLRVSRDFRLLFIGQTFSYFGSMMRYAVLPWQMYQLTKSNFAVGMLGVVEFVPMFFAAFIGGALADYIDRKRLIWLTEIGLALTAAILIFNSLLDQPRVWVIFVVAGAFAGLNGLQRPAREAITARIVPPEYMPAIAALNSFRFSVGAIVGPSIGGVIAAKLGSEIAYSIDFFTYVISLGTVLMIKAVPPPQDADKPSLQSIVEGVRYAKKRQELLGTYLIDLNAMFFGMPMALFPSIAEGFGRSESVGLLYAAPAVGSLVISLVSGWLGNVNRHGLAITVSAGLWGVAIIFFGLVNSFWLALFFLAAAGGADTISAVYRMTVWNQTVPDYMRGRLAGIEMISYMTGPQLGNAEAGIVASLAGIRASVVSGGILCVLGTFALAALLPKFIAYDAREGMKQKEAEEAARAELSNQETNPI